MRVLLGCSLGGLGHLTPVVAAARALGGLGHHAVVLVPPSLSDAAAEAGVEFRVGGEPPRSAVDELWEQVRAGPPEAVAGLMDRELFAQRCTGAMLARAAEVCAHGRPHMVIREPCEYATALVAHEAGSPCSSSGSRSRRSSTGCSSTLGTCSSAAAPESPRRSVTRPT